MIQKSLFLLIILINLVQLNSVQKELKTSNKNNNPPVQFSEPKNSYVGDCYDNCEFYYSDCLTDPECLVSGIECQDWYNECLNNCLIFHEPSEPICQKEFALEYSDIQSIYFKSINQD